MRIPRRAPPRALARAMIPVRGLWNVVGVSGEEDVLLDDASFGGVVVVDTDEIVCRVEVVVQIEVVFPLADCVGPGDKLLVAGLDSSESVEELPLFDSEVRPLDAPTEDDEGAALVADEDNVALEPVEGAAVDSQPNPSHRKAIAAVPLAMSST